MSTMARCAPDSTAPLPMTSPSPLAPPVMTTTRSSSEKVWIVGACVTAPAPVVVSVPLAGCIVSVWEEVAVREGGWRRLRVSRGGRGGLGVVGLMRRRRRRGEEEQVRLRRRGSGF